MATIPYANVVHHEPLPINAESIATKVRLVIAGSRAGAESRIEDAALGAGASKPHRTEYLPTPIVYEYEAPEHATYGAVKSVALPDGVNPFLAGEDLDDAQMYVETFQNWNEALVTPPQYRDGLSGSTLTAPVDKTQSTYLTIVVSSVGTYVDLACGFYLRYLGEFKTDRQFHFFNARVIRTEKASDNSDVFLKISSVDLLSTEGVQEVYHVFPRDAASVAENRPVSTGTYSHTMKIQFQMSSTSASGDPSTLTLHEFYPLILNVPLLDAIAKAEVILPSANPKKALVEGYVAPAREHTITGFPGGDYTGSVKQQTYEKGNTLIEFDDLGGRGYKTKQAILGAVDSRIESQTYGLKLGERQ